MMIKYPSMITVAYSFELTLYLGLSIWLKIVTVRRLSEKEESISVILTAIESRFAFASVRPVNIIATCIIVASMGITRTLVYIYKV